MISAHPTGANPYPHSPDYTRGFGRHGKEKIRVTARQRQRQEDSLRLERLQKLKGREECLHKATSLRRDAKLVKFCCQQHRDTSITTQPQHPRGQRDPLEAAQIVDLFPPASVIRKTLGVVSLPLAAAVWRSGRLCPPVPGVLASCGFRDDSISLPRGQV